MALKVCTTTMNIETIKGEFLHPQALRGKIHEILSVFSEAGNTAYKLAVTWEKTSGGDSSGVEEIVIKSSYTFLRKWRKYIDSNEFGYKSYPERGKEEYSSLTPSWGHQLWLQPGKVFFENANGMPERYVEVELQSPLIPELGILLGKENTYISPAKGEDFRIASFKEVKERINLAFSAGWLNIDYLGADCYSIHSDGKQFTFSISEGFRPHLIKMERNTSTTIHLNGLSREARKNGIRLGVKYTKSEIKELLRGVTLGCRKKKVSQVLMSLPYEEEFVFT